MPLVCINRDFLTLNSSCLTVCSVTRFPSIILLLSRMKIRGKYEYFHDSIKMASVVLWACATLYTTVREEQNLNALENKVLLATQLE